MHSSLLVVEDDDTIRETSQDALGLEGFDVSDQSGVAFFEQGFSDADGTCADLRVLVLHRGAENVRRDGIEAFQRALVANLPQVVVSPADLDQEIRAASIPLDDAPCRTFGSIGAAPLRPGSPLVQKPAPDPGNLDELVIAVWENVLGRDDIEPDDSFFDLGGHSLLLVQVHRELSRRLDREVSFLSLFQHPTPRALAHFLKFGTPHAASSSAVGDARLRAERHRKAIPVRPPKTK
jgi:acyl carrier protein